MQIIKQGRWYKVYNYGHTIAQYLTREEAERSIVSGEAMGYIPASNEYTNEAYLIKRL